MTTIAERLADAGIEVKPLEWEHHESVDDLGWGTHDECVGVGGYYNIEWQAEDRFVLWCPGQVTGVSFPTPEDAKSAVQADYTARILAALQVKP